MVSTDNTPPQQQPEEPKDIDAEVKKLDAKTRALAEKMLDAARKIVAYAMNKDNLAGCIYDSATGEIYDQDMFNYLVQHADDPDNLKVEEIADALETYAENLNYDNLDKGLKKVKWQMKIVVIAGLGATRGLLALRPGWKDELKSKRETLILNTLYNSSTIHAYQLLKTRPKLLKFITNYTLLKLGITPTDELE